MQDHEVIDRAAERWASGARADALMSLRTRVRAAPAALEVRLALVERYRELGAPDQAGRWGLAVPGLTTSEEQDRAARLFAASGVDESGLATFLVLPAGSALPAEVVALLPEIDRYRQVFQQKAYERWRGADRSTDRLGDALEGVLITLVCSWLATLAIVWGGSILGAQMTNVARWASLLSLTLCGLFSGMMAFRRGAARRPWAAVGWGAACLALFVGVLRLLALATEYDGVIRFAWEH
ncbi:hypothetical protein L2091_07390 [Curtobacterium albidum]|uniref:hypothetical protein n=1 Tax=Curtobacterium citreum TaxID=2036 RepID=UPI002026D69F|nr:hypothetical protein [Curtobacterium albidum]MCL9665051.1 hypothetical protein [Curtobacterium albidum]